MSDREIVPCVKAMVTDWRRRIDALEVTSLLYSALDLDWICTVLNVSTDLAKMSGTLTDAELDDLAAAAIDWATSAPSDSIRQPDEMRLVVAMAVLWGRAKEEQVVQEVLSADADLGWALWFAEWLHKGAL